MVHLTYSLYEYQSSKGLTPESEGRYLYRTNNRNILVRRLHCTLKSQRTLFDIWRCAVRTIGDCIFSTPLWALNLIAINIFHSKTQTFHPLRMIINMGMEMIWVEKSAANWELLSQIYMAILRKDMKKTRVICGINFFLGVVHQLIS